MLRSELINLLQHQNDTDGDGEVRIYSRDCFGDMTEGDLHRNDIYIDKYKNTIIDPN